MPYSIDPIVPPGAANSVGTIMGVGKYGSETGFQSTSVLKSGTSSVMGTRTGDTSTRNDDFASTQGNRVIRETTETVEKSVPMLMHSQECVDTQIVVPQIRNIEEMGMKTQRVKQKRVEVAKPKTVERIIEVPEYEYREKIVSFLEKVRQERIKEVPVIEYQERITEVPKIVYKEKIVKVPEYEYVEVVTYRDVEVVTHEEEHVIKEVVKPVLVEKPTPEYLEVADYRRIDVNVPYPVECITNIHFEIPKLNVTYRKIDVPISVPKFVEIPVPTEYFPAGYSSFASMQRTHLKKLVAEGQNKEVGVNQIDLLEMDNEIKGANWDRIFQNEAVDGVAPIDKAKFVDEAFKNNEFTIDVESFKLRLAESDAIREQTKRELDLKYADQIKALLARKDAEIEMLNAQSAARRQECMEIAFERSRNQAKRNLESAGLDPREYLNDSYDDAMSQMVRDPTDHANPIVEDQEVEDQVEEIATDSILEADVKTRRVRKRRGAAKSTKDADVKIECST